MKESVIREKFIEDIASQKDEFRRHQRSLPFGEKMQIAFSLAARDKTIRRAVLLSKSVFGNSPGRKVDG